MGLRRLRLPPAGRRRQLPAGPAAAFPRRRRRRAAAGSSTSRTAPSSPGGFDLPVAKSYVSWLDEDRILLGTDFGPGSLTTSSYPRTSRILQRGSLPLRPKHTSTSPRTTCWPRSGHDSTPGFERDVRWTSIDFFNYRTYLRRDGGWLPIDVPTDVNVDIHRQWLLMRPQRDWELGGTIHPAGSLLAAGSGGLPGRRPRACGCCSPRMRQPRCSPGAGRRTTCC